MIVVSWTRRSIRACCEFVARHTTGGPHQHPSGFGLLRPTVMGPHAMPARTHSHLCPCTCVLVRACAHACAPARGQAGRQAGREALDGRQASRYQSPSCCPKSTQTFDARLYGRVASVSTCVAFPCVFERLLACLPACWRACPHGRPLARKPAHTCYGGSANPHIFPLACIRAAPVL